MKWTPGLTRIISFGGGPTRVPEAMIERLKERLDEINREGAYTPFKRGDKVRIRSGPLQDFDAVFDQHLSSADRVQILVNVLGSLRRAEISVDEIERVD